MIGTSYIRYIFFSPEIILEDFYAFTFIINVSILESNKTYIFPNALKKLSNLFLK